MAMSLATLEILEQAQIPPAHARAIAKALEVDSAARLDALATKTDLNQAITGLRAELKGDSADLRREFKGNLTELKSDLRVEIHDVKSELVRWLLLAVMSQVALSGGIMYFLLDLSR